VAAPLAAYNYAPAAGYAAAPLAAYNHAYAHHW
jgi:hypothetical protein